MLVKTTFKDDLVLFKPLINFYNENWKPQHYIIYILVIQEIIKQN